MNLRHFTHLSAVAALVGVITTTAGCASRPGEVAPAPTSTADVSPEPVPTPDTPGTETPPRTDPTFGSFTRDDLAQYCIAATVSAFKPDVQFDVGNTRVEQRTVSPEWGLRP